MQECGLVGRAGSVLTFDEACGEKRLYAAWLVGRFDTGDLAKQVAMVLREGGYEIPAGFGEGLGRLSKLDLADFKAANYPFELDDSPWLNHCRQAYPAEPHPSLSVAERNRTNL